MKRLFQFQCRTEDQRHGAAHVLIAAMLFTFVLVAAMTVDFAYMQLIRTELRTATDAAAKAGAEALARTQDGNAARAAAVQYAGLNKVGGRTYAIRTSDVTLGRVTGQANGTWTFTANATPFNSVRVNAKIGNGGVTPAMNMFFAPALGHAPFSTAAQATAGQQEVEVCLCIDRSGSMMFDMTGDEWSYPSPNPLLYSSSHYPNSMFRNYCSPPQTTASRWAIMRSAVNIFLDEAGQFQYPPRTALVTWSSAISLPYHPYTSYSLVDTDYNLPAAGAFNWSTNRAAIESVIATRSNSAIAGGCSGTDRFEWTCVIQQGDYSVDGRAVERGAGSRVGCAGCSSSRSHCSLCQHDDINSGQFDTGGSDHWRSVLRDAECGTVAAGVS
jgi:Ca-activated chloride channel homolog